jgi:hypothetical protein
VADFAIYWKNYTIDCESYGLGPTNPLVGWRTNSERLASQVQAGDRLWFFVAGETCGGAVAGAAYLANVFRARGVEKNRGDNPEYPADKYRYRIIGEPSDSTWVEPVLADTIIRSEGYDTEAHIGQQLQSPRQLTPEVVMQLESLL